MDYYEGGWQELLPNCGNLSLHHGAEVGQHGEVMLLPWRYAITRDEPDEIEVRFEVRTVRTPFHLVKSVSLRRNEAVLRIRERVITPLFERLFGLSGLDALPDPAKFDPTPDDEADLRERLLKAGEQRAEA